MNVAFLYDDPGYVGGAELTMREFAETAPEPLVELVEAETVVVGNCFLTDPGLVRGKRVIRFVHDHRGAGPIDSDHRIFYSPIQRDRCHLDGELCPAPLDRSRFEGNGQPREGAVHIGTFGHLGKGQQLLAEWAQEHGPLAVHGPGPFLPEGPGIDYRGVLAADQVPGVLHRHRTFVHLPTEVEGYGRNVAEAWAAGCELVVNRNVGCLHWIENEPEAIDHAADRFWELVNG